MRISYLKLFNDTFYPNQFQCFLYLFNFILFKTLSFFKNIFSNVFLNLYMLLLWLEYQCFYNVYFISCFQILLVMPHNIITTLNLYIKKSLDYYYSYILDFSFLTCLIIINLYFVLLLKFLCFFILVIKKNVKFVNIN